MSQRKIAHLIPSLGNGGCENSLLELIPQLTDFEHVVIPIQDPSPLSDKFTAAGITVLPIHQRGLFDSAAYPRLFRLLKREQPDILITYLPFADMLGRILGRASGIKTIICSIRARLAGSNLWPFFVIDGLTSPLVSKYHFNSPASARTYRTYFRLPKHKSVIITNGVKVPDHVFPRAQARAKLNLHPDDVVLGCIAHVRRQKGHIHLIRAFAQIARARLHLKLLLVGAGNREGKIKNQIALQHLDDRVSMLGNRYDVTETILPALDICILPTLYEGMSKALLEAAAFAKPIITTNIPENRAIFTHQQNALLVPPRDAHALAAAIIYLIDHPNEAARLGQAAQTTVTQHYTLASTRKLWQQFLTDVGQ